MTVERPTVSEVRIIRPDGTIYSLDELDAILRPNHARLAARRRGRPRTQPATCTVDGCDDPTKARGLCQRHYAQRAYRARRNGR